MVAGLDRTGALRNGPVVAHTSGAHGLAVLGDVNGMALHPAMTFTGADTDLDRLPGIAWGVTAPDRVFATRLVADLGGVPEWVAEESRPVYHATLAHGANHMVTLVNEAADLLRAAGVGEPRWSPTTRMVSRSCARRHIVRTKLLPRSEKTHAVRTTMCAAGPSARWIASTASTAR